ncbi:MAG: hypothetical protein L0K86_25825, partial [Actinomycetia bacterium]|nr:hypothetical protein [Actinomycetes bacterium]
FPYDHGVPQQPQQFQQSQAPHGYGGAGGYQQPGGYPQQPGYAGQPPQFAAPRPPAHEPKKRKKWPFIVGGIVALIVIIAAVNGGGDSASTTAAGFGTAGSEAKPAAAAGHAVTYQVSGPAKAGNVTYTKEGFQMEQVSNAKLPWSKDLTFKDDITAFSGLSLVAMNGGTGGDITCKILVDGKEIASSTSSGAYAVVTCNGSNA